MGAKHSIRIKSKSEYVIEVNDAGETISFDISDVELPLKYDRCLTRVRKAKEKFARKQEEFKERYSKDDLVFDESHAEEGLSEEERFVYEAISEMYNDLRKAMDEFLGYGACQKIFGNTNTYNMFELLMEALEPHFEALGINNEKTKEQVKLKYSNAEDDVL